MFKKKNIWLEITTLIIPGYTDTDDQLRKIAKFIKNDLGIDTPWHLSKFYPAYKLLNTPPTPPETILKTIEIGRKEGLKYVYAGNLNDEHENTYCPNCHSLIIERIGYITKRYDKNGLCSKCGQNINLILK